MMAASQAWQHAARAVALGSWPFSMNEVKRMAVLPEAAFGEER